MFHGTKCRVSNCQCIELSRMKCRISKCQCIEMSRIELSVSQEISMKDNIVITSVVIIRFSYTIFVVI